MIEVSRLNGEVILINPDLLRTVESKPDTVLTFVDGQILSVKETSLEIKNKVLLYKKECTKD